MAVEGPMFVDTWGWLVLADARDPAFQAVSSLRRSAADRPGGWVTTDYVLDETITRLTPKRFTNALKMRRKYKDKPRFSFTDLTSFVVMRELGLRRVITADANFEHAGLGFSVTP